MLQIKYFIKCPYFKKPPLPRKIPGYAPDLSQNLEDLGLCSNIQLVLCSNIVEVFLCQKDNLSNIFLTSYQQSGLVIPKPQFHFQS